MPEDDVGQDDGEGHGRQEADNKGSSGRHAAHPLECRAQSARQQAAGREGPEGDRVQQQAVAQGAEAAASLAQVAPAVKGGSGRGEEAQHSGETEDKWT